MNIKEWIRFCVNSELIDETENEQFVKAFLVYKKSLPIEVDELQINTGTNYMMPFVVWCEAICRCIESVKLHISKERYETLKVQSYVDYVDEKIMPKEMKVTKRKQVNRTKKENTEQKKQAIKTLSDNSYFKRGCSLKKANDEKINPTILAWKIKCVFQVWKERFKLMDRNSIL